MVIVPVTLGVTAGEVVIVNLILGATAHEVTTVPVTLGVTAGEVVGVEYCTDVLGGFVGEGVLLDELEDVPLVGEQAVDEVEQPRVVLVAPQSGKPHLPVQARLVRDWKQTETCFI